MTDLEKVEKLREKANVSYAEAKEALDKSNSDILEALIYLENQGKSTAPAGGGFYSGAETGSDNGNSNNNASKKSNTGSKKSANSNQGNSNRNADSSGNNGSEEFSNANEVRDAMGKFGAFCAKVFNKGFSNHLVASKGGQHLFAIPVFVVAILVLFFFWITIPLFVISLFCGFAYRFRGAELDNDAFNSVMDGASHVADDIKKSFNDEVK